MKPRSAVPPSTALRADPAAGAATRPRLPFVDALAAAPFVALALIAALAFPPATAAAETPDEEVAAWEAALAWPEEQRAFLQDGPGWLLTGAERAELLAMDAGERAAWIEGFLSNPAFAAAVAARRELALAATPSPTDVRARLLFLHGPPSERLIVDCGLTFRPLEVWTWGDPEAPQRAGNVHSVLVHQDGTVGTWRLWLPASGKRVLYTREMEHWLEEWEEHSGGMFGVRRFDLQACREARRVDRATGVRGLSDADADRPREEDFLAFLAAPADLASWSRRALEQAPAPEPALDLGELAVRFPARDGQRITTRLVVALPAGAAEEAVLEERVAADGAAGGESEAGDGGDSASGHELRLVIEGLIEHQGRVFDSFRVRFRPQAPEAARPVALVMDRSLRPDARYLVRLAVRDEVSGRVARLARAVTVPSEPRKEDATAAREEVLVAMAEDLAREAVTGADHLLLVPPEETVVLGLWRAEALVSGSRIARVEFLVDGTMRLSRSRPPYTAELRLDRFPREQVIGAVGYDAGGEVVAADEVIVNQPRGALRVRIVEPVRGVRAVGRTTTRIEVTVPDGRRVERLEVQLNDQPVAVLERPPWEAVIEVPSGDQIVYLTAAAWLDDGSRAEDVRVLNAPGFGDRLEVSLVELYVAAIDRHDQPLAGLVAEDFRVLEDGRRQQIIRFEEVRDLPLALGLMLDVSGSMESQLAQAERAAQAFVRRVLRPGDVAFALAFSDRPVLRMPPTDDIDGVADALSGLRANGATVLHDALITALYYFRGLEGQKALIVLSDGDDNGSVSEYEDALEYARRMNAAIYTIGLDVGRLALPIRRKLDELAHTTGGRSYYISQAAELDDVYERIEQELRSRYFLAYAPDPESGSAAAGADDGFREVDVEIVRPGVTARTARGYSP